MESENTRVVVTKKSWYASKTLWANFAAVVGAVGVFVSTGETEALYVAGLGIVNFFLRIVTGQPLE